MYSFNDGSLNDESPNSHNLTNTTNATSSEDRNGNDNCAFHFDNSNIESEFLSTDNSQFLNELNQFSISIWYQPLDTSRAGGEFENLISRGDNGRCPNRGGEWSIALFDCRRAVFGHDNSVWANVITDFTDGCQGEINALTNNWHHVVAIKNNDIYKIYFNGNLDETDTGNANCNNLLVAEDIGDLIIANNFTGNIDDILIYDREILESEVSQLFNLGSCCE